MASFSSYCTLWFSFNRLSTSRAFSGKPSFFNNGNTAAFTGANGAGMFMTVRCDPSSNVSSLYAALNVARNMRSRPMEVSTTNGT